MKHKKAIQIHVPKTGGASIKALIAGSTRPMGHSTLSDPRFKKRLKRLGDKAHLFTFLRDPLDRAVSQYHFLITDKSPGRENPKVNMKTPARLKSHIICCMARAAELDINTFWQGLLKEDGLQFERLSHVVPHLRAQHLWFDSPLEKHVHYYDFGNFEAEANRLLEDLVMPPRAAVPHKHKGKNRGDALAELTPETQDMIRKYFVKDYELLESKGIKTLKSKQNGKQKEKSSEAQ